MIEFRLPKCAKIKAYTPAEAPSRYFDGSTHVAPRHPRIKVI